MNNSKYSYLQNQGHENLLNCLYQEAKSCYEKCIEINPKHKNNYWYLGLTLLLQGKQEEAEEFWFDAVFATSLNENDQLFQELTDVTNKLAQDYYQRGFLIPSAKIYHYLLEQNPISLEYKFYLATICFNQGNFDQAIYFYQHIIEQEPNHIQSLFYLGKCFYNKGDFILAYQYFYKCILLTDDNLEYKQSFVMALQHISFTKVEPQLLQIIETCFENENINHQKLLIPCLSIFKLDPLFNQILQFAQQENYQQLELLYQQDDFTNILNNKIFNGLLRKTLLNNLNLEFFLSHLRKILLFNFDNFVDKIFPLEFIISLGIQAFNNEYIWNINDKENEKLNLLVIDLEKNLDDSKDLNLSELLQRKLALFGMYRHLKDLKNNEKLLNIDKEKIDQNILLLIEKQIKDYQKEAQIKTKIKSLTTIDDTISVKVKSQYEENPYPRWLGINLTTPQPVSHNLAILFPHFEIPEILKNRTLDVLVAGCGTGSEAIQLAALYKDTKILAVDLSLSSLAYGIRMSKKLGITNIDFQQADILSLASSLNQKFDLIFSSGVIHHLENPLAGLKVLVELLVPSGILKLGLYSDFARQSVLKARKYIQQKGFSPTLQGIREFRKDILIHRETLTWVNELTQFSDFYSTSKCRDLVFHVNEHEFTINQIENIINSFGLKFIGFEISPENESKYQQMFKDDPSMTNLSNWQKFEETYPNTFTGMYNFWCQKL